MPRKKGKSSGRPTAERTMGKGKKGVDMATPSKKDQVIDLTRDSDEIIVDNAKVPLLRQYANWIQENHTVKINFGDIWPYGDLRWTEFIGEEEQRKKAKDYVRSLCSATSEVKLKYPVDLHALLTNTTVCSRLEDRSKAVLKFAEPGEVTILGLDPLPVTLAMSALEDVINKHIDGVDVNRDKEESKSGRKSEASNRLHIELRRHEILEDDYSSTNDAVKRTILSWMMERDEEAVTKNSSNVIITGVTTAPKRSYSSNSPQPRGKKKNRNGQDASGVTENKSNVMITGESVTTAPKRNYTSNSPQPRGKKKNQKPLEEARDTSTNLGVDLNVPSQLHYVHAIGAVTRIPQLLVQPPPVDQGARPKVVPNRRPSPFPSLPFLAGRPFICCTLLSANFFWLSRISVGFPAWAVQLHGNGRVFSCRGIQICVDYLHRRGHTEITAFVPQWRTREATPHNPISHQHLLDEWRDQGFLVFKPARHMPGKNIVCYDDKHGEEGVFSCKGIKICVDYFRDRGHTKIKAFVPQECNPETTSQPLISHQHLLKELSDQGFLDYATVRHHEDNCILLLAEKTRGIIVSNDNYRDLWLKKYN